MVAVLSFDEFQDVLLSRDSLTAEQRSFLSQLMYAVQTAGQMARDTPFQIDPTSWLAGCLASILSPFTACFPLPPDVLHVVWFQPDAEDPVKSRMVACEGDDRAPGRLLSDFGQGGWVDCGTASAALWLHGYVRVGVWREHPGGVFSIHVRPNTLPMVVEDGQVVAEPVSDVLPELVAGALPLGDTEEAQPTISISPLPNS